MALPETWTKPSMRKAERLFQILTLMRGRRTAITAAQLSEALEVSVRTIYRDVNALICSGVPVEGEAGIGYFLRPGYQIPPLMFDADETLALLLGVKMVKAWTDPDLGKAAERAAAKILSVLPDALLQQAELSPYQVPYFASGDIEREKHGRLRRACEQHRIIAIQYEDAQGRPSERRLWPLGLTYWGEKWTLIAWCEKRQDYRHFRIDRITHLDISQEHYPQHAERSLRHFLAKIREEYPFG